jgi:hypothetical protein
MWCCDEHATARPTSTGAVGMTTVPRAYLLRVAAAVLLEATADNAPVDRRRPAWLEHTGPPGRGYGSRENPASAQALSRLSSPKASTGPGAPAGPTACAAALPAAQARTDAVNE